MLTITAYGIYVLALAAAGTSDLARYQIPNGLSLALVAGFALYAAALPFSAVLDHVLAGFTVFGLTSLLFASGVCGGGDVKLLGATALWMGWSHLAPFLLVMAVAGGVLALMLLMIRRWAYSGVVVTTGARPRRLFAKDAGVPYGVAIAIAGVSMLPQLDPTILATIGAN